MPYCWRRRMVVSLTEEWSREVQRARENWATNHQARSGDLIRSFGSGWPHRGVCFVTGQRGPRLIGFVTKRAPLDWAVSSTGWWCWLWRHPPFLFPFQVPFGPGDRQNPWWTFTLLCRPNAKPVFNRKSIHFYTDRYERHIRPQTSYYEQM